MTKTRNLSDLLDANGDVKLGNLDNVPASNDASALTTGTLPIARIADGDIALAKLSATGTKDATTFLRGDNSFQEVPAGGITEVDMWRITANASIGSGAVRYGLTSNWERADTYSFAKIGDGMTESSGIFSFTNTGIYYVEFSAMAYIVSSTMRAVNVDLIYTADNSNYVTVCNQEFNVHNTAGNSTHGCATARYIFDITDVSNQKLKFGVWDQSGAAGTVQGNTDTNFTFVTFMKLGDT